MISYALINEIIKLIFYLAKTYSTTSSTARSFLPEEANASLADNSSLCCNLDGFSNILAAVLLVDEEIDARLEVK